MFEASVSVTLVVTLSMPPWSVVKSVPASIAVLVARSLCVSVEPPLLASAPSPASATPTWLLFTPFVKPPEPPVPIRLNEPVAEPEPLMSSAVEPEPAKLPATMVLRSATDEPWTKMPPPVPEALLSASARLLGIVTLIKEARPFMPPPLPLVELPLMVVLIMWTWLGAELAVYKPPPDLVAVLLLIVLLLMYISTPGWIEMAPPP